MQRQIRTDREAALDLTASFEGFFEDHHRSLYGALCLVTGNRAEAEEIMQDAFLKIWERWDRVGRLEDPGAYLYRTGMNLFRNRMRRASVAARRAFSPASSSDDLAAVEDRDEVVRFIRPLPPRQRAAMVLTIYLGYSSEEAARILGIRPSTVRALVSQGRSGVRQAMEGGR
jgi:RNA polymerase sigma-70 factor (ECF subfamily)